MENVRVIARLDVKNSDLVKGIQFEGLRKLGKQNEFAIKYYEQGADELLYIDIVASLYERNHLQEVIKEATKNVFIPITVGGGIRKISDVETLLNSGADKVVVNTGGIKRPELISEIAKKYGSQCVVVSIEAKKMGSNKWEAYYDNGREKSGLNAIEWAVEAEKLGAGEILVTSVDRDGTEKGFDIDLIKRISGAVSIPVIAGGGMGKLEDSIEAVKSGGANAVAVASVLHYNKHSIEDIKRALYEHQIEVRRTYSEENSDN